MDDIRAAGVDELTIGQYLQPKKTLGQWGFIQ
jgi:lipoate synthase